MMLVHVTHTHTHTHAHTHTHTHARTHIHTQISYYSLIFASIQNSPKQSDWLDSRCISPIFRHFLSFSQLVFSRLFHSFHSILYPATSHNQKSCICKLTKCLSKLQWGLSLLYYCNSLLFGFCKWRCCNNFCCFTFWHDYLGLFTQ